MNLTGARGSLFAFFSIPMVLALLILGHAWAATSSDLKPTERQFLTSACEKFILRMDPAAQTSPDGTTRMGLGAQALNKLLEKLANPKSQWTKIYPPKDPFRRKSRIALDVAASEDGFSIPSEINDRIQSLNQQRDENKIRVQSQVDLAIARLAEMGIDYKPTYYRQLVKAIDEVVQESKFRQNNDYLNPLIAIVYQNSVDFTKVVNTSALLDEALSQLLSILYAPVMTERLKFSDAGVRDAVSDIVAANFRSYVDPLDDRTLEFLASLAVNDEDPRLTEKEKEDLAEAVGLVRRYKGELVKFRTQYADQRTAAAISWSRLSQIARPDGDNVLETYNLMRRYFLDPSEVLDDDFGYFREIILNGIAETGKFYHPGLQRFMNITWDLHEELAKFGSEFLDPQLLSQVHHWKNFEREDDISQVYGLDQELARLKDFLGKQKKTKILAEIDAVSKEGVKIFLEAQTANQVPAIAIKEILAKAAEGNGPVVDPGKKANTGAANNAPNSPDSGSQGNSAAGGTILPIPSDLDQYVNEITVSSPWAKEAIRFLERSGTNDGDEKLPIVAPAVSDAKLAGLLPTPEPSRVPKPTHPQNDGPAYAYLIDVLKSLERRAYEISAADVKLQMDEFTTRTPINEDNRTDIELNIRKLLNAVNDVAHGFVACMLSHGATEMEAEATFAWHLDTVPGLERLIINKNYHRGLVGIQRELIMEGLTAHAKGFKLLDPKDSEFAKFLSIFSWKSARQHSISIGVSAVIITGAILAYSHWGNSFWAATHSGALQPKSPPAITAPADKSDEKKDAKPLPQLMPPKPRL